MEALPLNVSIPHLQTSARLFNEMLKQSTIAGDRATGQNGHTRSPAPGPAAAPLNSHQVRGSAKPNISQKPAKRKSSSRSIRRCVLVVDDAPDVTEMIALLLKHAGYEVATADSATTALRLANEKAFDLVISDIGMPEMNGYELAEFLRRRAEYHGTPIIALTGYSEYDDRGRALRAGFNAHLTKPIDPTELLHLMNELLG